MHVVNLPEKRENNKHNHGGYENFHYPGLLLNRKNIDDQRFGYFYLAITVYIHSFRRLDEPLNRFYCSIWEKCIEKVN